VVRNGVQVKKTGLDELGTPTEEAQTYWQKSWVDRQTLRRNVYQRRENDVTKESNRVSVSRAVHALVERELLDALFPATGVIEDGAMRLCQYGHPSGIGKGRIGDSDSSRTYSLVTLSNKGEKKVRSLRTTERNDWEGEIRGDRH
jgi:hypothetical protein